MAPPKPSKDSAAYQSLKRDLKEGTLQKLYLFHGEESYLREYYLEQVQKKLLPAGMESFNLHRIEGKQLSSERLSELLDALPMMSERTVILVSDYDLFKQNEEERRKLCAILSDIPDYACLIFVYDLLPFKSDARIKNLTACLREQAQVVNFTRQSRHDLTDWIRRRFASHAKSISASDTEYLIFLSGDLMQALIGEIEKIASFSKGAYITRAEIDLLATPLLDAVVFQLTDALLQKDDEKALSILGELLSMQESPIMILAVLGKQLRQLLTARALFDEGKLAGELMQLWGMRSSYPAEKLLRAARGFSPAWCCRALRRCFQLDLAMKSQTGFDPEAALVDFVLSLSQEVSRHAAHS